MSDNWVVQNLENALNTWNEKLAEIWQLITQSPENFKGGTIWNVIVDIHGAVQAIFTQGDLAKMIWQHPRYLEIHLGSAYLTLSVLEGKMARLKNKIDNLISMRADGEITKEEFKSLKDVTETELHKYMEEKKQIQQLSDETGGMELDMNKIKATLDICLDFSKPKIDESIVDKFVSQIIPIDNGRYRWDLNFLPDDTQSLYCRVEGRKNHADVIIDDEDESPHTYLFSVAYSNISKTAKNAYQSHALHRLLSKLGRHKLYFEFSIGFEEAKKYREANGQYLRPSQWQDLTCRVYI